MQAHITSYVPVSHPAQTTSVQPAQPLIAPATTTVTLKHDATAVPTTPTTLKLLLHPQQWPQVPVWNLNDQATHTHRESKHLIQ